MYMRSDVKWQINAGAIPAIAIGGRLFFSAWSISSQTKCCNLDYLVSDIASKKSSQETYVTSKYRLENNGSEPRLNDIGARLTVLEDVPISQF